MAKILVIDDDVSLGDLVAEFLSGHGHTVVQARNGSEGLQMARQAKPGLIVLDLEMPMLSGVEVCQMLKSDPKTAGIKIIMLTGSDRTAHLEEALAAGADAYLLKPFDEAPLIERVTKVLG